MLVGRRRVDAVEHAHRETLVEPTLICSRYLRRLVFVVGVGLLLLEALRLTPNVLVALLRLQLYRRIDLFAHPALAHLSSCRATAVILTLRGVWAC